VKNVRCAPSAGAHSRHPRRRHRRLRADPPRPRRSGLDHRPGPTRAPDDIARHPAPAGPSTHPFSRPALPLVRGAWRGATLASRSSCAVRCWRPSWIAPEPTILLTLYATLIAVTLGVPAGVVAGAPPRRDGRPGADGGRARRHLDPELSPRPAADPALSRCGWAGFPWPATCRSSPAGSARCARSTLAPRSRWASCSRRSLRGSHASAMLDVLREAVHHGWPRPEASAKRAVVYKHAPQERDDPDHHRHRHLAGHPHLRLRHRGAGLQHSRARPADHLGRAAPRLSPSSRAWCCASRASTCW